MEAVRNDFHATFDPTEYLEKCFKSPEERPVSRFALANLHDFFATKSASHRGEQLRVLDYGSGPVIANVISAASVMDLEIVLAEHTEKSRKAIQDWLDIKPSAWDWHPYFKYIVQTLEGKGEEETWRREAALRASIKAVVPCDITQDSPIAKEFEGPYDIVMSMLCIENGCLTREEYKLAVKKIADLIKPGGTFLLHSTVRNKEGQGYYHVGVNKYVQVALPLQFLLTTLEETGFTIITKNMFDSETISSYNNGKSDLETTAFITAEKSK